MSAPVILSPTPGSTLANNTATFSWSSPGQPNIDYGGFRLILGSSLGHGDLWDAQVIGAALSVVVTGLPTDGRTIYLDLITSSRGPDVHTRETYVAATGVRLDPGGSPGNVNPSEVNVDRTLQLAADQFEIAVAGSAGFTAAELRGNVEISSGFLEDPYLAEEVARNIEGAVTDEAELHVLPDKMTSVLRGRSLASYVADGSVYMTFVTTLPSIPGTPPPTPTHLQIIGLPLRLYGAWTARTIAQRLCAAHGLGLSWGTSDYTLREDFSATGTVLQAVQTLVSHMSYFEPSKVDVWEESGTLIVRGRGSAPGTSLSLSVHDARITDLMVRKRFLGYIGTVRVIGNRIAGGRTLFVDPGNDETDTEDEMTKGEFVTLIKTHTVTRILDRAVLNQRIETWVGGVDSIGSLGKTLTDVKDVTSDWEGIELDSLGRMLNRPKERSRVTLVTGFDPGAEVGNSLGGMVNRSRITIAIAHDDDGYMTAQDTETETWNPDAEVGNSLGGWETESLETKTYRRNGSRMYEITTTQYGADGSTGPVRRTTANGTPPGGPGTGGGGGGLATVPIVKQAGIGGGAGARDLNITSDTVFYSTLFDDIVSQARQANGATEWEVSFTAANIPWLRQGQFIQLTGLEDELGYDIPLAAGLVTEVKFEYREDGENPSSLTHVKYVWWA